jgi:hypothetical protein
MWRQREREVIPVEIVPRSTRRSPSKPRGAREKWRSPLRRLPESRTKRRGQTLPGTDTAKRRGATRKAEGQSMASGVDRTSRAIVYRSCYGLTRILPSLIQAGSDT